MPTNHSLIATMGFPFGSLPLDPDFDGLDSYGPETENYIARIESFSGRKQTEFQSTYLDEGDESLDASLWWM